MLQRKHFWMRIVCIIKNQQLKETSQVFNKKQLNCKKLDETIFTHHTHNVHINAYVQNSFHLYYLTCYWYRRHSFFKKIGKHILVGQSCTPATSQTDLKAALSSYLGSFPKLGSSDSSSAPPVLAECSSGERSGRAMSFSARCSQLLLCHLLAKIISMKSSGLEGLPFC